VCVCVVYAENIKEQSDDVTAADDDDDNNNNNNNEDGSGRPQSKKSKVMGRGFELDVELLALVKRDVDNQKLWDDALPYAKHGQQVT